MLRCDDIVKIYGVSVLLVSLVYGTVRLYLILKNLRAVIVEKDTLGLVTGKGVS